MEIRRLLATVIVNTLADESIANGTTSLREAIASAAANDIIQFTSGLAGTITLAGQELVIGKGLTIAGPGAGKLSISANNASRVLTVQFGTKVVMSGLTIKQGRANAALAGNGGTISEAHASLPGGSAAGGAIYSGSIEPSLTRCTFTSNSAIGGGHSGHGTGGAVYATSGLNARESTFDSNKVVGRDAEGLDPTSGGAAYGGAISVSGGVLTITGSTLSRNSAAAGRGTHAVYWRGYEEPAAKGGNAVGGAIAASAPAFLTRSTLAGNSVKGGAGGYGYDPIYVPDGDGGDARGAGIDAGAGLTLTACTIAGNTAIAGSTSQQGGGGADGQSVGGGVRGAGALVFANTIIATNVAGEGPDVSGTAASQGLNLIGKADGGSGWIASDKRGTIASPLDPRLAPLASNGGPTRTMVLLPDSPALDAGKAFGLTTDQRGVTRPRNLASVPNAPGGDGSDIGAFELQTAPANPQTPFRSFILGATPLTIENEDFDSGGEGIAYHDADAANLGGNAYRAGAGVDLKTVQNDIGGVYVGFTKAGEWLEYTVNIASAGTYTIDFRVASGDLTTYFKSRKAAGHRYVTLVLKAKSSSTTQATFSSDETASGPRLVIGT